MSRWLFDLGNSRLKCAALLDDGRIGDVLAVTHDGAGFAPGWADMLPVRIDAAYVASVAPAAVRVALLEALCLRCGRISGAVTQARVPVCIAGADAAPDGIPSEVTIAYAQPQRLGVDRFLGLLAARARGARAWLVVGVGTALTIDLLDAAGQHRGGRIAPSPTLMRQALHARAAQLPASGGHYQEFASDTGDALASGCEGAAAGLVDRSLLAATVLLGEQPGLLLHGGGASAVQAHFPDALSAPALVLEGLASWARLERDPRAGL